MLLLLLLGLAGSLGLALRVGLLQRSVGGLPVLEHNEGRAAAHAGVLVLHEDAMPNLAEPLKSASPPSA